MNLARWLTTSVRPNNRSVAELESSPALLGVEDESENIPLRRPIFESSSSLVSSSFSTLAAANHQEDRSVAETNISPGSQGVAPKRGREPDGGNEFVKRYFSGEMRRSRSVTPSSQPPRAPTLVRRSLAGGGETAVGERRASSGPPRAVSASSTERSLPRQHPLLARPPPRAPIRSSRPPPQPGSSPWPALLRMVSDASGQDVGATGSQRNSVNAEAGDLHASGSAGEDASAAAETPAVDSSFGFDHDGDWPGLTGMEDEEGLGLLAGASEEDDEYTPGEDVLEEMSEDEDEDNGSDEEQLSEDGVADVGEARGGSAESTTVEELQTRVAEYILPWLQLKDVGCSAEEHAREEREHNPDGEDHKCCGIDETLPRRPFVRRTADAIRVGLGDNGFPAPSDFGRGKFISKEDLRNCLEGGADTEGGARYICLSKDHSRKEGGWEVEYDIDALIVTTPTFEGINSPARLCFTKQVRFNISGDLHLTMRVPGVDSSGRRRMYLRQIRNIPHLYLGGLRDFNDSAMFAVFPRITPPTARATWLTDALAERFFDIWLAAIRNASTPGSRQYIPPDAEIALSRARARGKEHQSTAREGLLKETRYYVVGPETLARAWREVQAKVAGDQTGLGVFRDAVIFVNTKNTKLEVSSASLLSLLTNFEAKMQASFDVDRIEYWADLAVKVVASDPATEGDRGRRGSGGREGEGRDGWGDEEEHDDGNSGVGSSASIPEPMVYLFRACCLERCYGRLQQEAFGTGRGRKQVFHNGYLREATTMTLEPPSNSWVRKGGLAYAQFYNSHKEFEDAQKIRPFDFPQIKNLALPENITGPGDFTQRFSTIRRSYCESKKRARQAYHSWRLTAPGVRIEFRISGHVLRKLRDLLQTQETTSETPTESFTDRESTRPPPPQPSPPLAPPAGQPPPFVWAVPTAKWCRFMAGNIDKITSTIEAVILCSSREGISQERSEVLWLLLQYLQKFSNSNPKRTAVLWRTEREPPGGEEEEYGLGLEKSLPTYGFGWLAPLIDWHDFRLKKHVEGRLIGCRDLIGVGYRDRVHVAQSQDDRKHLELCIRYLKPSLKGSLVQGEALQTAAHIVLRRYRRDILEGYWRAGDLCSEFDSRGARDEVQFCDAGLRAALTAGPYYVSGRKVCGASDPGDLFTWLFGVEPCGRSRKSFDGIQPKRYRQFLRQVSAIAEKDVAIKRGWLRTLQYEFHRYTWSIPYPDTNGCLFNVHTPTGQRVFLATRYAKGVGWIYLPGNGVEAPASGHPLPLPKTLGMSYRDLEAHFHHLGGGE